MAVGGHRPLWVRPMLTLAIAGASIPPVATGVLLMRDVKLANFCNDAAKVNADRALHDAHVRHLHEQAAFPVGGCVALAVAFGGAAGASLSRRWRRWLVAAFAFVAMGGFLAADFTGKKEAWHTLSPSLEGWAQMPLPPGMPQLGITMTHPECAPDVRAKVGRRVAQIYWVHVIAGVAMAAAAAALGLLGMTWRREA